MILHNDEEGLTIKQAKSVDITLRASKMKHFLNASIEIIVHMLASTSHFFYIYNSQVFALDDQSALC